ncbi:MAG: ribosome silencing factor [Bacteroidales bacterium]|nr:ribosome silencing factor [Bacteroidales bacterium]
MLRKNELTGTEKLLSTIVESIKEKKGKEIISIDLQKLEQSITDYFIICHADSNTQVDAITDSIIDNVKGNFKTSPYHKEGIKNLQWVLLDYSTVIVHIFQKEFRDFYKLEELWADGKILKFDYEL